MSCKDYIVWISGHIDGTNSKKEEQSLDAHLSACPQCRRVLEEMKANDAVLKKDLPVPPERIARNVMVSVRNDCKKKTRRILSYLTSGAAVAAVLCLILVGSLRAPDRTSKQDSPGARSVQDPAEARYTALEDAAYAAEGENTSVTAYGGTGSRNTKVCPCRGGRSLPLCFCRTSLPGYASPGSDLFKGS